jgi:hypothetical protein
MLFRLKGGEKSCLARKEEMKKQKSVTLSLLSRIPVSGVLCSMRVLKGTDVLGQNERFLEITG